MLSLDSMLQIIIVGICTGVGSSIGTYFVNRGLIKHLEKIK
jgi:uncharacterized protein YneF (UPF0154 family)